MMGKQGFIMALVIASTLVYAVNQSDFSLISSNDLEPLDIANNDSQAILATQHLKKIVSKKALEQPLNNVGHRDQSAMDRLRLVANKTELQEKTVAEYDNFKRYPPQNSAIKPNQQDPITQRYDVDERTTMNDDGTVGLTIWSDEKYYVAGNNVVMFAYLQDAQGQRIKGDYSARLLSDQQDTLTEFSLEDNDNDQLYEASIELNSDNTENFTPGIYKVIIEESSSGIKDALTFTLSQPDIRLTGEFKDQINEEGGLLIEAQVEVTQDSQYYIQASLYSATQVPIGITQLNQTLTTGKHWVELNFAGLMIQDAQESGPYVLQQMSLAKVTMPMQRAPLTEPNFQTDSYGLDEFSNQTYHP